MRHWLAVAFLIQGLAFAQDVAIVREGDLHIQGFGGFTFIGGVNRISTTALSSGLTPAQLLTPNTNGSIGVQVDYSFTRRFMVQADYSYLAGGSLAFNRDYVLDETTSRLRRVSVDAHSSARIGNVSLLVRLPLVRSPRLVPYAGVGAGFVRTHFELKQAVVGDAPGQTFSGSTKANDLVGSAGAGTRYYFTERLGLTVDLRFFAGPGTRTLGRASVGVFFKVY